MVNRADARRVEGVITIDSIVNFIQQRRHQAGRPVFGAEVEGAGVRMTVESDVRSRSDRSDRS